MTNPHKYGIDWAYTLIVAAFAIACIVAGCIIALLLVSASTSAGYNTPEVDDMTMHRFNAPRSLAEVVGQDRYQLATLTEKVDGIIRRGVVTRVRPTGEGFEYTFPDGVDAVYLVDVEIYNPGAQPVTLQGIESAIPVRPGHGVRVLIPGGDVTRGPIVVGRLEPGRPDQFTILQERATPTSSYTVIGQYQSIGARERLWEVEIRSDTDLHFREVITLATALPVPPASNDRYPETITVFALVRVDFTRTSPPAFYSFSIPVRATLYSDKRPAMLDPNNAMELIYTGTLRDIGIFAIDEAVILDTLDLTQDAPVDQFDASMTLVWDVISQPKDVHGQEFVDITDHLTTSPLIPNQRLDFEALDLIFTEISPGTK